MLFSHALIVFYYPHTFYIHFLHNPHKNYFQSYQILFLNATFYHLIKILY